MLNLFAIAKQNAVAISQAYQRELDSISGSEASIVSSFATWVEATAQLSINARLHVLVRLVTGGAHLNTYELTDELARLSGRTRDDLLRERLNTFYEKRTNFDLAFVNGDKFRYGMLNGGGVGLSQYGTYCLVLDWSVLGSVEDIAYLPGDSLKLCLRADGSLDQGLVEHSTTPHSHRHFMAAKERVHDILSTTSQHWPEVLVSSKDKYFEAIFIGTVTLSSVKCVRIVKSEYDRLWDMAFKSLDKHLSDAERAEVDDFLQFRRGVVDGIIKEEVMR